MRTFSRLFIIHSAPICDNMAYSTSGQVDLKEQLTKCWKRDYDWSFLPNHISKVSKHFFSKHRGSVGLSFGLIGEVLGIAHSFATGPEKITVLNVLQVRMGIFCSPSPSICSS